MAENDKQAKRAQSESDAADNLGLRFPDLPPPPDVPAAPEIQVTLPPHPDAPKQGALEPGTMQKSALGYTAASAFIMPVIVLSLGGYFLDTKLHHATYWFAMVGLILGLIVGVSALLRVVNKLNQ